MDSRVSYDAMTLCQASGIEGLLESQLLEIRAELECNAQIFKKEGIKMGIGVVANMPLGMPTFHFRDSSLGFAPNFIFLLNHTLAGTR